MYEMVTPPTGARTPNSGWSVILGGYFLYSSISLYWERFKRLEASDHVYMTVRHLSRGSDLFWVKT